MNYTEYKITIEPFNEGKDVVIAQLAENGFESFVEEEPVLKAYAPENIIDEKVIEKTVADLQQFFRISYEVSVIEDRNWNEEWEKNYEDVIVDENVRIRAPFHDPDPEFQYDIEIKPQMSFGTAHHDTTRQMLEVVSSKDVKNLSLLDMGCGTGVIAILAALKGATPVTAIDNDEWAWENTKENVQRNSLELDNVLLGDASLLKDKKWDIIIANINRNILLNDMEHYAASLNNPGELWMSGFYEEDLPVIKEKAESLGLKFISAQAANRWVAAGFKK
jgi:ribosomal protein L11 methyltransferase